jgi:hypothetical protein
MFCHKKRGFRASFPFDILHTIQLGWMMYILQGALNSKLLKAKISKKEKKKQKNQQVEK